MIPVGILCTGIETSVCLGSDLPVTLDDGKDIVRREIWIALFILETYKEQV